MTINIQFINKSTILSQQDANDIVNALQIQVSHDFAPVWGVDAKLFLAPKSFKRPTPGCWVLAFLDNADQAGALGYHDLTSDYLPLGKVFVKTTIADGGKVSVTASHELLEMLGDPDINLSALTYDASENVYAPAKLYAYETCDACEDDQFGYTINGVLVSDFVYPSYFEQFRSIGTGTIFDKQQHITAPFQILPGGYMGVLDFGNLSQGWQQVTADKAPNAARRPHVGSRRERRGIPKDQWQVSKY